MAETQVIKMGLLAFKNGGKSHEPRIVSDLWTVEKARNYISYLDAPEKM